MEDLLVLLRHLRTEDLLGGGIRYAIATLRAENDLMCAEKTGGFNLVNYRHSSGVYHEQETEDLHRRI